MEASPNLACATEFQMNSKPWFKYVFSSVQAVRPLKAGPILSFSLPDSDLAKNPYKLKLPIFLEEESRK